MSFDPTHRRVARALDRAQLESVLTEIEAGLHDDEAALGGAVAVALIGIDPDGIDIACRPLGAADVVDALVGFDAPPDWLAFGVVCHGRARPLLDGDRSGMMTPDPTAEPTAVGLALLVDRSGGAVSGLRSTGGDFVALPDPAPVGRVPDACRRVLGLGTPPPTVPVAELWSTCWLERVLTAALARPGALTWGEIAALRPATELDGLDWGAIRHVAGRNDEPAFGVRPEAAAWMDDGMFSREILSRQPPLSWLIAELEPVLPDPLRQRLVGTIGRPPVL